MSGPRREDEPEWGVLTYNLALAKFQQRHILQVIFLLPLFVQIDIWSLIVVSSVADPDPGSGIGAFLTPGSGIPNSYF
jgi:hypothetical protein